jgi:tetratricopeptide (TPR) repeat protein
LCQLVLAQPSNSDYSKKAKIAYDAKEWDNAIALYKQAITLNPKDRDNYNLLLQSYNSKLQNENNSDKKAFFEKELEFITKIVKSNPLVARGYSARSVYFYFLSQYQNALNDLSVAIKLDPNEGFFYYKRGNFYLVLYPNNLDSALQDYNKAISLGYNNPEVFTNRGTIFIKQKMFSQAIDDFTKVITLMQGKEGIVDVYGTRAALYAKTGQNDLAILDYDAALKIEPYNYPFVTKKRELIIAESGINTTEIAGINTSISDSDNSVTSAFNASGAYQKLLYAGQDYKRDGYGSNKEVSIKKAIACFTEAIRLYPNVYDAYFSRAFAYQKNGNTVGAKSDLEKVKTLNPSMTATVNSTLDEWEGRTNTNDVRQPTVLYNSTNTPFQTANTEKHECVCTKCKGSGKTVFKSSKLWYETVYDNGKYVGRTTNFGWEYEDVICSRCLGTGKCK